MNTRTTLIAVAAFMMAVCTQLENPGEERTPIALAYTTVDATETKAAQNLNEGTFDPGEAVKVRISNTGESSWTDYDFTTAAAGAMSPAGAVPYYPAGAQNIDIVAYYPSTAGTSFSVQTDQTADADYKASDLMFASVTNQAKQAGAVGLAFSHKMAKINVNITAGTGIGSVAGVILLNIKPTVSFDRATGAVGEATGTATAIAMSNGGAAVIPAQTIDGGLLSIVTDKGTATYTVAGKEFAAGQQYTINITVNLRAVGTTSAITGWTSEGTVTVVAERPNVAGHEYIDMGTVTIGGVEKNLKWATCNLGASDPWEYGDYYAWGATVPFYLAGYSQEEPCTHWIEGKSGYNWASYPFMLEGRSGGTYITKYTIDDEQIYAIWYSSGGMFIGDGKTSFADYEYADDAARQRWGGTWRIPTIEEWQALLDDSFYDWEWTDDYLGDNTGHKGRIVTRKAGTGPCSGNSIFLPAAGGRNNSDLFNAASDGYYWSSSLDTGDLFGDSGYSNRAYYVDFYVSGYGWDSVDRFYGFSVRAVTE